MLFGFFLRVSSADPPQPYRGFEKPLGHAGGPSGFFKSPLGFGGSGRRSPRKNPNNLYIFFSRSYIAIFRGFVCVYTLGDLCAYIPWKPKVISRSGQYTYICPRAIYRILPWFFCLGQYLVLKVFWKIFGDNCMLQFQWIHVSQKITKKICMLFGFSSSGIFARSPSTLSGIWKTPLA